MLLFDRTKATYTDGDVGNSQTVIMIPLTTYQIISNRTISRPTIKYPISMEISEKYTYPKIYAI